MTETPKRSVRSVRKATDKRKIGTVRNLQKVKGPSSESYKPPMVPKIKGKPGRPKKIT